MNVNIKAAIERLRELAAGASPLWACAGLCCEMEKYAIDVKSLAEGWNKHSGDKFYPIPATSDKGISPLTEYSRCMDLWGGEQGKLRGELCAYIADKLEKKVGKL